MPDTKEVSMNEMSMGFDEALKTKMFGDVAKHRVLFDEICPTDDWKMPFNCRIEKLTPPYEIHKVYEYSEACSFFTGAPLKIMAIETTPEGDEFYHCYCKGYYNAMG